jgi:hypothetical protein
VPLNQPTTLLQCSSQVYQNEWSFGTSQITLRPAVVFCCGVALWCSRAGCHCINSCSSRRDAYTTIMNCSSPTSSKLIAFSSHAYGQGGYVCIWAKITVFLAFPRLPAWPEKNFAAGDCFSVTRAIRWDGLTNTSLEFAPMILIPKVQKTCHLSIALRPSLNNDVLRIQHVCVDVPCASNS